MGRIIDIQQQRRVVGDVMIRIVVMMIVRIRDIKDDVMIAVVTLMMMTITRED